MDIRRAQAQDRAVVLALINAIDPDDYIPYCWDEWVADYENGIPLVAWFDGSLLGLAHVQFLSQRVAWLQALRVAPTARRLGVGTALTETCLRSAARARRHIARLLIDIDNRASLSLTAKAGFTQIAEWLRLEKSLVASPSAPLMRSPLPEHLPQLVKLARQHGLDLWHTDWQTYDLDIEALQVSLRKGSLQVLADKPTATMLDIVYDEDDQEYKTYNPVGDPVATLELLQAMEQAAYQQGLPRVAVLLAADSPFVPHLQQLGYEFARVQTAEGKYIKDGVTIWEYDLTTLLAAETN